MIQEWVAGTFPIPEWVTEQNDWHILYDSSNGSFFFEPRKANSRGLSDVWLVKSGEVVRWVDGSWFFGEVKV